MKGIRMAKPIAKIAKYSKEAWDFFLRLLNINKKR